jgi:hypothetical protein
MPRRSWLVVGLLGLMLMLGAGCGDDDDDEGQAATTETTATETTPSTETETTPAETDTGAEEEAGGEDEADPPPEEQPGGAGDEEPAQTQVTLTGRDGRVTPRNVSVAPFIAIRVELRSGDGERYGFSCGGNPLIVDRDIESVSTRLAGKRAGRTVDCIPLGDHNAVVISFSSEAGP